MAILNFGTYKSIFHTVQLTVTDDAPSTDNGGFERNTENIARGVAGGVGPKLVCPLTGGALFMPSRETAHGMPRSF